MAEAVLMPKLGATMEKGTITQWFKSEGEFVKLGEPILEIMTDKINIEVESTAEGVLLQKLFEEDAEIDVLQPIAYIGEAEEVVASNGVVVQVEDMRVTSDRGHFTRKK